MRDADAGAGGNAEGSVTPWGYNEEKFGELLLYVAKRADGAIKLNKYLYFAEAAAMRILGHPITGAEYQRLRWGPAPRRLLPVRSQLISEGAAAMETETDPFGHIHHRLVPRREPHLELFSDDELRLVDKIIDALEGMTGAEVSELSHKELGWELVEEGETIPYELALVQHPSTVAVTEAKKLRAKEIAQEHVTS